MGASQGQHLSSAMVTPGPSVAGRVAHGSYLHGLPIGIPRTPVISRSEHKGAVHVAPEGMVPLISVGRSYTCL